jgi:hypothetical protein
MNINESELVERARRDLASRLGVSDADIVVQSVEPDEFPNSALGAPLEDEMSAQVITPGLRVRLSAGGRSYEYRANDRQMRLLDFEGKNFRV